MWPVSTAQYAGRPQSFEEADERLGARHEARDQQVFLEGVRPGTHHTETIERRHSQRPDPLEVIAPG